MLRDQEQPSGSELLLPHTDETHLPPSLLHRHARALVQGWTELLEQCAGLQRERHSLLEQRHILLDQRRGLLEQWREQKTWVEQALMWFALPPDRQTTDSTQL